MKIFFKAILVAAVLVQVPLTIDAQTRNRYKGLEMYNPYIFNPGFIETKNIIQIDYLFATSWTNYSNFPFDYQVNAIGSIDVIKSSFRLGYDYSNFSPEKSYNYIFGYSNNIKISDNFSLSPGVSFNFSRRIFDFSIYSIYDNYPFDTENGVLEELKIKTNYLQLGLVSHIKNLTVGASAHFSYSMKSIEKYKDRSDSIYYKQTGIDQIGTQVIYKVKLPLHINLNPQLNNEIIKNIQLIENTKSNKYSLLTHIGLLADYDEKYGIGLYYGSRYFSLIGSILFYDKVAFRLMFLEKRHQPLQTFYTEDGWNITAQISVTI